MSKPRYPIIECQWLRHGDPVPDGWRVASSDPKVLRHHGRYGVLIERTVSE